MKSDRKHRSSNSSPEAETELRIIGGSLRGRKLLHEKRAGTRPMKHRVREAIFNLVGLECEGRHAIDIFAGTGAIGLEALSRGASSATFIERHVPTSRTIEENIKQLGVADRSELLMTSAFLWAKRDLPCFAEGRPSLAAAKSSTSPNDAAWIGEGKRWILFCSPPFDFYVSRWADMRQLIEDVIRLAPAGSTLVVEADERLDFEALPSVWGEGATGADSGRTEWDIRAYRPAIVGVLRDARRADRST